MNAMREFAAFAAGLALAACAHDPTGKHAPPDVMHISEAEAASIPAPDLPTPPQTEMGSVSVYSGPVGNTRQVTYSGKCANILFDLEITYSSDVLRHSRAEWNQRHVWRPDAVDNDRRSSEVSVDFRVNGETLDPRLNEYVETGLNQFPVIMLDVESVWCMSDGDYQLNLFVVRDLFFMPGQHLNGAGGSREQTRDPGDIDVPSSRPRPYNLVEYNIMYNVNTARRRRERGESEFPIYDIYHSARDITEEARFPARIVSIAPFAEANCFGPVLGYPFTPEGCGDDGQPEPGQDDTD